MSRTGRRGEREQAQTPLAKTLNEKKIMGLSRSEQPHSTGRGSEAVVPEVVGVVVVVIIISLSLSLDFCSVSRTRISSSQVEARWTASSRLAARERGGHLSIGYLVRFKELRPVENARRRERFVGYLVRFKELRPARLLESHTHSSNDGSKEKTLLKRRKNT